MPSSYCVKSHRKDLFERLWSLMATFCIIFDLVNILSVTLNALVIS